MSTVNIIRAIKDHAENEEQELEAEIEALLAQVRARASRLMTIQLARRIAEFNTEPTEASSTTAELTPVMETPTQ